MSFCIVHLVNDYEVGKYARRFFGDFIEFKCLLNGRASSLKAIMVWSEDPMRHYCRFSHPLPALYGLMCNCEVVFCYWIDLAGNASALFLLLQSTFSSLADLHKKLNKTIDCEINPPNCRGKYSKSNFVFAKTVLQKFLGVLRKASMFSFVFWSFFSFFTHSFFYSSSFFLSFFFSFSSFFLLSSSVFLFPVPFTRHQIFIRLKHAHTDEILFAIYNNSDLFKYTHTILNTHAYMHTHEDMQTHPRLNRRVHPSSHDPVTSAAVLP